MMTRNTVTTMLALSFALGTTACKKKGGDTTDPGSAGGTQAAQAAAKADKEAKEDFDKALSVYDEAMKDGSLSEAECTKTAGKFEGVYKDHPKRMQIAYFNAATILESCGKTDQAKKMYEELAKENFHLALNNLGVMYWNKGDERKAMEYFEKSVNADKKLAFAARNNLAAGLRDKYTSAAKPDKSVFEQAELQIQNVLAVDTSNRNAYENLARLYYDRGRLADRSYLLLANLVVTQAIRVLKEEGNESADLYNLAGLLRMQDDNQVEALKAFKRATTVDAKHTDANLNIAFISIRFRDYTTAETSLDVALKDPTQENNIEAVLAMGVAKRGLKKYEEAKKYYERAAKIDAKDPRPWYNLGILEHEHILATKEDVKAQEEVFDIAKKHYKKFVDLAGANKEWAALVDDAKGRMVIIDDAIQAYRKAEEMQKKAAELAELEKKQAEEERNRLLELEKKAMQAADSGGGDAPAPAPEGG